LITADHGNADQMVDYETGMTKTSHTLNLVDCIYVANDAEGVKLRKEGILSDIAPTVLDLMGIEVPADMTSKSLLA
ncbi:MAG: 2,3-bisphosphoglycerate-independent phosphoglycerate mutase, partial [Kiritimatiellae bacterium]|nr:2,3-bisphosphoglycerate-independent phosphoglycerate mutase [Kiritimatiellia bacterium]